MKDPTNFPETTRRWEISGHFDADVCVEIIDVTDRTPGPGNAYPVVCELEPLDSDWHQSEIDNATLISAAPEMLTALRSLKLRCLCDALNPCWDNRESDQPGMHWGSTPENPIAACAACLALAAIAKAEGR